MNHIKLKRLSYSFIVLALLGSCQKINENDTSLSRELAAIGTTREDLILHSKNDTSGFIVLMRENATFKSQLQSNAKFEDKQKTMHSIATSFLSQRNIKTNLKYVYSALNGFAADLSEKDILSLQKDPEVALIRDE